MAKGSVAGGSERTSALEKLAAIELERCRSEGVESNIENGAGSGNKRGSGFNNDGAHKSQNSTPVVLFDGSWRNHASKGPLVATEMGAPEPQPIVAARLCGVGLTVEPWPPHTVINSAQLDFVGPRPRVNVAIGDVLELVDGNPIPAGIDGMRSVMLGPVNSIVLLTLRSLETGLPYDITLRRHRNVNLSPVLVPQNLKQTSVSPNRSGGVDVRVSWKDLTSMAEELQSLRFLVNEEQGLGLGNLLLQSTENRTSIGVSIGSRQIIAISPGGPAMLTGLVKEGDEILRVDGVSVEQIVAQGLGESNAVGQRIRANGCVGSSCCLHILRGQQEMQVVINRTLSSAVTRANELFKAISALRDMSRSGVDHEPEEWENAIEKVFVEAVQVERAHQTSESTNFLALRSIHLKIIAKVDTLEKKLGDAKQQLYLASGRADTLAGKEELDQAKMLLTELSDGVRRRDKALQAQENEIAKLRHENQELKHSVLALEGQLRSASNMIEDWQQLQQSLQQKQLDYQNRSVVTEHELKSLHTKVWQLEKEQRVRASQYHHLLETHQFVEAECHALRDAKQQLSVNTKWLEGQLQHFETTLREKDGATQDLMHKLADLNAQLNSLKAGSGTGAPVPVQLIMKLALDFSMAGSEGSDKREEFKRDVAHDLSTASGLPPANFRINNVSPGSIILDIQVMPDPLAPGKHVLAAKDLADQAGDMSSKLLSGKLTSHTIGEVRMKECRKKLDESKESLEIKEAKQTIAHLQASLKSAHDALQHRAELSESVALQHRAELSESVAELKQRCVDLQMERDDLSDALESQAVSIEELNAKDKRIAELKDGVATLERESRQAHNVVDKDSWRARDKDFQLERESWELREAEFHQQQLEWKHEEKFLHHEIELLQQQIKALSSQTSERGVIGLSLEQSFPWRILAVNEVMDEYGRIINDELTVGHEIAQIDDWETGNHDVTEIFQRLAGPPGTLIHATFREGDTGRTYTRIIQRHKPLGGDARFGTVTSFETDDSKDTRAGSSGALFKKTPPPKVQQRSAPGPAGGIASSPRSHMSKSAGGIVSSPTSHTSMGRSTVLSKTQPESLRATGSPKNDSGISFFGLPIVGFTARSPRKEAECLETQPEAVARACDAIAAAPSSAPQDIPSDSRRVTRRSLVSTHNITYTTTQC